MLKQVSFVCLVVSSLGALTIRTDDSSIPDFPAPNVPKPIPYYSDAGNANQLVDMLLENVRNNQETPMDPFMVPDRSVGFEHKPFLIKYKGEIKLHKGVLTGISTLHRTGNCSLTYGDGAMYVKVKLGMGVLNLKTTGAVKFMGLGPSLDLLCKIGYADIEMDLAIDPATMKPTVTKFKLVDLRGLRVEIDGLGPLDHLFKFFSNIFTDTFKITVKFITEQVMSQVIKDTLTTMKLSFGK